MRPHTALLRNTKIGYFTYAVQIKKQIIGLEILYVRERIFTMHAIPDEACLVHGDTQAH